MLLKKKVWLAVLRLGGDVLLGAMWQQAVGWWWLEVAVAAAAAVHILLFYLLYLILYITLITTFVFSVSDLSLLCPCEGLCSCLMKCFYL